MAKDPFEDPTKQKQYLKIATFGGGGSGKTRMALSFPKCCVIDTERGTTPYKGKYDFKVRTANRWRHLDGVLTWLRQNPGVYETLAIDSATVFYLDLIQDIIDYIRNKRGSEIMSPGDWGVEKRRWFAFCNQLVELPMHVILSFREKEEYEETVNRKGEEVRKKTGNFLPEWDKQTEYLFDLTFRCHTEENKKDKSSKFLMTCTKTRFEWMPKYSVHDVTKQRVFASLFEAHVATLLDAPDGPPPSEAEPLVVPDTDKTEVLKVQEAIKTVAEASDREIVAAVGDIAQQVDETADKALATEPGAQDDPGGPVPQTDSTENLAEIKKMFGVVKPSKDQPEATMDDIRVLMIRAGDMIWPDDTKKCRKQNCDMAGHVHPGFKSSDAKNLIKSIYGVETSKDLRKPQIDFLYGEFGKVLSGRAFLAKDSDGDVYVATPVGTTEEEVKRNILSYAK